jgi:2-keto-4-pentenoate hydratase/2-oxohepta-3-ene-1,7-dioic acid hydratase in catechol pathway
MRFATVDGRAVLIDRDRALDIASASRGAWSGDPLAALERWDELRAWAAAADWASARPVRAEELGAPVPAPRQVFAIGLNYAPHAAEAGFAPPAQPMVFTKFPSCISGPITTVALPPGHVDWEIEVVAVLAGLTLGQDLSERIAQLAGPSPQFSLAKSHPGFGPTGPVLVTADEFADRDAVGFQARLGDEVIQHGNTRELIFPIDMLVEHISASCPLLPGDLIFTGTPGGVGNRRTPPRFLRPGEVLVSRLDGVGEIRQTFA